MKSLKAEEDKSAQTLKSVSSLEKGAHESALASGRREADRSLIPASETNRETRDFGKCCLKVETTATTSAGGKNSFSHWRNPTNTSGVSFYQSLKQRDTLEDLLTKIQEKKKHFASIDVKCLPDGGLRLIKEIEELENKISFLDLSESDGLPANEGDRGGGRSMMTGKPPKKVETIHDYPPGCFGLSNAGPDHDSVSYIPQPPPVQAEQMAAARPKEVRSVVKKKNSELHRLSKCSSQDELPDLKGLSVSLMPHQEWALSWLLKREKQNPSGGILADDMGLGKTITMISLIVIQKELSAAKTEQYEENWHRKMGASLMRSNATLIICPASLLLHWNSEIEKCCPKLQLNVVLYHGPGRMKDVEKFPQCDIVITSYNIVNNEVKDMDTPAENTDKVDEENQPSLSTIAWRRIVLDEAHTIKNPKTSTAKAICHLHAKSRWAMTGTPIQNELRDICSLLKFLRVLSTNDYEALEKQIETTETKEWLDMTIKSLLLRRTKEEINADNKSLVNLPNKHESVSKLQLSPEERRVYDELFMKSRSMVQGYLKQHGYSKTGRPDANHCSKKKTDKDGTYSSSHIFVQLLRLRQCCCHLSMTKLTEENTVTGGVHEHTLTEQMKNLSVVDNTRLKSHTNPTPKSLFSKEMESTKIKALMCKLREIHREPVAESKETSKSVVVSEWTEMLGIVAFHLQKADIRYHLLQGDVAAKQRAEIVTEFNENKNGPRVLLLSLKAGGVGLNLIGGNHIFILNNHWNPALEEQACDRIHRIGQKRDVTIHRFICEKTIEEKIVQLQKRKRTLAEDVLTESGSSRGALELADLKELFDISLDKSQ